MAEGGSIALEAAGGCGRRWFRLSLAAAEAYWKAEFAADAFQD